MTLYRRTCPTRRMVTPHVAIGAPFTTVVRRHIPSSHCQLQVYHECKRRRNGEKKLIQFCDTPSKHLRDRSKPGCCCSYLENTDCLLRRVYTPGGNIELDIRAENVTNTFLIKCNSCGRQVMLGILNKTSFALQTTYRAL